MFRPRSESLTASLVGTIVLKAELSELIQSLFCVPEKREGHTCLERHEGE